MSYITYQLPKDKFIMVSNKIIDKFNAEIVGIFCKIAKLSAGKTLKIEFIAKKINISKGKVQRAIVILEKEGYIVRDDIRDAKGHIIYWNYRLFSEPVPESERSHAGKKTKKENPNPTKNQVPGNPTTRESNHQESEGVNILSNTDVLSNNNEDLDFNKDEKLSNDNQNDDLSFEHFYKLYPQKKGRKNAEKAWARLSDEDKKAAIERLPAYIADCFSHKRTYQHPATYLNGGTWTDVFDSDGEEELTEENAPTILPPGMTKEQWEKITKWMVVNIKHIAGKITPIMLYQMKKEVKGNSQLLNDILCDLDYRLMDICNYDIFEEFCKLLKTDEYQQEL